MAQFQRVNGPAMNPRAAVHQGGEEGVRLALEHIAGVSQQRTPIDEGTLRRSTATTQSGLEGVVSADTPYAVFVHEDLTAHHPRGGQAKFMESAFQDEKNTAARIIAQAIRRKMGG